MIPIEDLTDVTLVSEDTFWRLDWCDSGEDEDEDEEDDPVMKPI